MGVTIPTASMRNKSFSIWRPNAGTRAFPRLGPSGAFLRRGTPERDDRDPNTFWTSAMPRGESGPPSQGPAMERFLLRHSRPTKRASWALPIKLGSLTNRAASFNVKCLSSTQKDGSGITPLPSLCRDWPCFLWLFLIQTVVATGSFAGRGAIGSSCLVSVPVQGVPSSGSR